MRTFACVAVFVAACIAGCQSTPADKLAFKALNSSWTTIGPEYSAYVTADPTLDPVLKDQKAKLVGDITRLLAERSK